MFLDQILFQGCRRFLGYLAHHVGSLRFKDPNALYLPQVGAQPFALVEQLTDMVGNRFAIFQQKLARLY